MATFIIMREEKYLKYPMKSPTFSISNIIESYYEVEFHIITKNVLCFETSLW